MSVTSVVGYTQCQLCQVLDAFCADRIFVVVASHSLCLQHLRCVNSEDCGIKSTPAAKVRVQRKV